MKHGQYAGRGSQFWFKFPTLPWQGLNPPPSGHWVTQGEWEGGRRMKLFIDQCIAWCGENPGGNPFWF